MTGHSMPSVRAFVSVARVTSSALALAWATSGGAQAVVGTGNPTANSPAGQVEPSRHVPPRRTLEPRLESGLLLPFSWGARGALPDAPVLGLHLHVANLLAEQWTGELGLSVFGATGATPALAQPYDLAGLHLQAGLGRMLELDGRLYFEPQLKVGNLWLWRTFRTFTAQETLRALTLSPAVELGATPGDAFRVALRFEASVFSARLEGPRTLHAVVQVGLLAGHSF